jgi:hypothetical protein
MSARQPDNGRRGRPLHCCFRLVAKAFGPSLLTPASDIPGVCRAVSQTPARRLEAGAALPATRPNVRPSDRYAEGREFESSRETASQLGSGARGHRPLEEFPSRGTNGGPKQCLRGNAWWGLGTKKPAPGAGLSEAADGTRTHDLLHGKQWLNPRSPLVTRDRGVGDTHGLPPITVDLGNEWVTESRRSGADGQRVQRFAQCGEACACCA